jgi:hypothetical protein
MTSATRTDADARVIDRYRERLLSGQTFALTAMSHRSRRGYMPPISRRDWAACMETVARMARRSDALAQIAVKIRPNLYGTAADASAHVWESAGAVLARGFDDVIGRAGPEAGRFSDHQRDYTLAERVEVACWLTRACKPFDPSSTIGWALEALADECRVLMPPEVSR